MTLARGGQVGHRNLLGSAIFSIWRHPNRYTIHVMPTSIPLFERAEQHGQSTAIVTTERSYTYRQLLAASARVRGALLDGVADLNEARIAYMVSPGFDYVATQWGIWGTGGVAVPLAVMYPPTELAHVIDDADVAAIVADPSHRDKLLPLASARSLPLVLTTDAMAHEATKMPELVASRRAMMLYTSGTTGKPKGVVTTHANIQAQIESLVASWEWSSADQILHVLPLHHVHGIINVLSCALWAGARCEFLPQFSAESVWDRFRQGDLTLFMAVPTMYAKLISAWQAAPPDQQRNMSAGCEKMRLMVSGSAALPVETFQSWASITGHVLLERYGMTEIGMALSNPLHGQRVPGHVGTPLPHVEVRRVDEQGNLVAPDVPGEIEVRGPSVFLEYWGQPAATTEAFREGWFRTGDVAVVENGAYRILGRTSVDIIKTGGYKVSALEIEEVLRTHPHIRDCAVVGVPDSFWGQRVSAALVVEDGCRVTRAQLRDWAKERLAIYKVPQQMIEVPTLPRNALGKVMKREVTKRFVERDG